MSASSIDALGTDRVTGSAVSRAEEIHRALTEAPLSVGDAFAREMLLTTATTRAADGDDTTTYYDIGEEDVLLSAPADIAANDGDSCIVSYTLDGYGVP